MKRFLTLALVLSVNTATFADTPSGLPDPGGKKKEEVPAKPAEKPVPPKTQPEESGVPVESAAADKMTTWKDPVTGYQYMYIPKKRTFTRATMACNNRGWDVFNLKYLSPEEKARFYDSPVYAALPWRTLFKGEPGEISDTTVWNSSEFRDFSSTAHVSFFKRLKIEDGRTRLSIEERIQGGMDAGPQYSTICMYRGDVWYSCSGDRVCKSYGLTAGNKYFYEMSSSSTTIHEYGSNEKDALDWINKGSTYQSPYGQMPKRSCELLKSSVQCERVR